NTSAGDLSPSALTRSSRPSLTNTVLALMPVSFVNCSSIGWIRPGSRVVYSVTSANALPAQAARPANIRERASGKRVGRVVRMQKAPVNANDYQLHVECAKDNSLKERLQIRRLEARLGKNQMYTLLIASDRHLPSKCRGSMN